MVKFLRISLAVLFLLSLPLFSVSAQPINPQEGDGNDVDAQSDLLCGVLAETEGLGERVDAIAAFEVDMSQVDAANISEFDRAFIQQGILGNTMEIYALRYSLDKVENEELRCAVEMMLAMHSMELHVFSALADQLEIDTNLDPRSAPVYPHTPAYNLGEREVDLVAKFLDPLTIQSTAPFDARAMHVLKQQHAMLVETALTAEHLVVNPEIKALAKHSVDVAGLHLVMLEDLMSREYFDYRVPMDFEEPYMDPHEMPAPVEGDAQIQ